MLLKTPGLFLIFLVLLSACGPLVPLSYDPYKPHNSLAQTIESPEETLTLQYLQVRNGYYIFDLEIVNHSSTAIEFAPQAASFYASPKLFPRLQNPSDDVHSLSAPNSALMMKRISGSNPIVIRNMYQQKAEAKAAASLFFAVLGAGLIIYDGVKDAQDNQKETWTEKDAVKAAGRDLAVELALTTHQIVRADAYTSMEDTHYFQQRVFPECRIEPGESVRGFVFIQSETSYRYSRVVVPIREVDYVFDFKRRGVKSQEK